MIYIADVLLGAGAFGAALYCYVLSRRLRRFTDLEKGVGGAVALLSAQVDDLNKMLVKTRAQARDSGTTLVSHTQRAEAVAKRIELLLASMHDLPDPTPKPTRSPNAPLFVRHPETNGESR
ncbi:hypothetical protein [Aestuariibius sp. HNIBRBA575]|uniref:hypothetical protein n=1 Tax=Aestuariibius sp. HNIBRBA575 TaxID=3233343 RepID=UPI0034A5632F